MALAKGLQHADAEDLAQDVLATVGRAIGSFDLDADGSFRGWLFKITRNLCVNHLTRGPFSGKRGTIGSGDSDVQRMLMQLPADEATVTLFTTEHRRLRFRQAAEVLKLSFSNSTWLSFWFTAVDGRSIDSVASELGMTRYSPQNLRVVRPHANVFLARPRVLRRLFTSMSYPSKPLMNRMVSINETVRQTQHTLDLFGKIEKQSPEDAERLRHWLPKSEKSQR